MVRQSARESMWNLASKNLDLLEHHENSNKNVDGDEHFLCFFDYRAQNLLS